ncbi:hypothetical protein ASPCAL00941 [Aspergillus calidoustus]|uniref:Uncharacterized protein n=1 Tax=Aspergillus calidoustus TaxID=454130 RepID=A0A0U5FRW8_ASPCI|nr:hypothetical protein ASPCAL00941 [Aspergillus calidoustus]
MSNPEPRAARNNHPKLQPSVERYTFAAIRSNTPDLPNLRRLIGACPGRRNILRQLTFNFDLPIYPEDCMRFFQRDEDEYNSLLAIRHGIKALVDELASWSDDAGSLGIHLLLSAESPIGRDAGGTKPSPLEGFAVAGRIRRISSRSLPNRASGPSPSGLPPSIRKLTLTHADVYGSSPRNSRGLRGLDVRFHGMHRRLS